MKKQILSLMFVLISCALSAQFTVNAGAALTYNHSSFFSAFRDAYNSTNAATISNPMGKPVLGYGYHTEFGFRIFNLQSTVGYSRFSAKTHASFQNGAKRVVRYEYTAVIVNIGGFVDAGESKVYFDLGMLACGVDQHSYVLLPNKEKSYTSGAISLAQHWLNLGMNFRTGIDYALNESIAIRAGLTYHFLNNDKEFAPAIEYGATRATLTFKGFELNTGLTFNLGKRID